jgi:hypothetical protein
MERESLEEKINKVVPQEMKGLKVYQDIETRVALSSLIQAIKEQNSVLYKKYGDILDSKEKEVIKHIESMDLEQMLEDFKQKQS